MEPVNLRFWPQFVSVAAVVAGGNSGPETAVGFGLNDAATSFGADLGECCRDAGSTAHVLAPNSPAVAVALVVEAVLGCKVVDRKMVGVEVVGGPYFLASWVDPWGTEEWVRDRLGLL